MDLDAMAREELLESFEKRWTVGRVVGIALGLLAGVGLGFIIVGVMS